MATEKFLYNTTRTRTLLITAVSMILISATVAIYSFSKNNDPKAVAPSPKLPSITITPGAKSSDKYVELQKNENLLGTKKAEEQGRTFIPTIINNNPEETNNTNSFRKELTDILKEKQINNNDYERLSKQLAMLLAQLNTQSNSIEDLLNLLRELQNQGYDIENLDKLLRKLSADGYKTDELAKLLEKLKQQGLPINDIENLLNKLLTDGYNPELINKILNQLLKDKLQKLENLLKKLQADGLDTKDLNNFNRQVNIPELTSLFEELAKRGYDKNSLDNLLKQLINKGYDIFDMNTLAQQLKKDGYNTDQLQGLLNKLKDNGKEITDLKNFIDAMHGKFKALDNLLNKLKADGLDTKDLNNFNRQVNIPELTSLFEELAKRGYDKNSLDNLLKQLINKGYDIFDMNTLAQQLKKDGYNTDQLQGLLNQLKSNGIDIADLNSLINALNNKTNDGSKNKLSNILNNPKKNNSKDMYNKDLYADNNLFNSLANNKDENVDPAFFKLEQKYQELLKKQEEKLKADENARKLKESNLVNSETKKKDIESMLAVMNTQVDTISKNLTKFPAQTFVKGEEKQQNAGSMNQSQLQTKTADYKNNDLIIKAGTILFGIMTTNVNSDQPGPVLAKIVHGDLKGTTLIGSVQSSTNKFAEGLIVSFQTANIPNKIRSLSISAVAIDPETARTAMATKVDHHYLLRWGSTFAAAFLKGYSKTIADTGKQTQTSINPLTGTTNTLTTDSNASNSKKTQIYKGLSEVANTWSGNINDLSSRPTTIIIDSGTSIGVMLIADFVVPASDDLSEDKEQMPYEKTNLNQNTTKAISTSKSSKQRNQSATPELNNNQSQIGNQDKNINSMNNTVNYVANNQGADENGSNVRR